MVERDASAAGLPNLEGDNAIQEMHASIIPVVVADTLSGTWKGLRRYFSQKGGFILVPAHQSQSQLLLQCQKLAPCVLLIDQASLQSFDPPEFATLVDYGRSVRVLLVGPQKDERALQNFVRMGCMGFIESAAPAAVLKKAVRALARGEFWLGRRAITSLLQQMLRSLNSQRLTPREREILHLIAGGLKNRAIAERLSISHETVRWHIRSLHAKLGLQDRLGTALYAQTYLGDELVNPNVDRKREPTRAKSAAAAGPDK